MFGVVYSGGTVSNTMNIVWGRVDVIVLCYRTEWIRSASMYSSSSVHICIISIKSNATDKDNVSTTLLVVDTYMYYIVVDFNKRFRNGAIVSLSNEASCSISVY